MTHRFRVLKQKLRWSILGVWLFGTGGALGVVKRGGKWWARWFWHPLFGHLAFPWPSTNELCCWCGWITKEEQGTMPDNPTPPQRTRAEVTADLEEIVALATQPDCTCERNPLVAFDYCEAHDLPRDRALETLANPALAQAVLVLLKAIHEERYEGIYAARAEVLRILSDAMPQSEEGG